MKKRLLAFLLVLVMVAGVIPFTALADGASIVAQGNCGDQGDNVTWVLTDDGVLTISGTGAMADYQWGDDGAAPWIVYKDQITKIVIGEGVTRIGDFSFFQGMNKLDLVTDVTIPETMASVGEAAFNDLASFTTVYYNGSPDRFNAFKDNDVSPGNDTLLYATVICAKENAPVVSLSISGSYKTIYGVGQEFSTSGIIATAVESDGLELIVTDQVTYSGFDSSTPGEKVITASFEKEGVTVTTTFTITVMEGGVVAGGICGAAGNEQAVTWVLTQDGKLTISGSGAMADYSDSTLGPWSVNRLDIHSLVVESGVTSVGDYAFGGVYAGRYENLTTVTFADSVNSIGYAAFRYAGIQQVTIPASVTAVGDYAFDYNKSLTKATVKGSAVSVGMFSFCSALTEATLEGSIKTIPQNAFAYCTLLETVKLPDSVTVIDGSAFITDAALKKINIPSKIETIGSGAFYGCSSMNIDVVLPETLTTLGNGAFQNTGIKSVVMNCPITTLEGNMFNGCGSLTSVKFADSIQVIKSDAFNNCISLTELVLPKSLTTIEAWRAFAGCEDLTTLTIYNKLSSIGSSAFDNCGNLKTVNFHGTEEEWNAISGVNLIPSTATVNFIVPAPVSIEISGQYKTKYKIGEDFDPSGIKVTAQISDGTTQDVTADATFSGFDSTAPGTKTITVTYGALTATFTVTVEEPAADITVKLTILGDTHHDMSEGNHGLWLGGLETWLPETEYTISSDAVVYDLLAQAFAADDSLTMFDRWTESYGSYYIYAVQKGDVTLTEKDNCANSGWMVAVNGKHVQVGVSLMTLKNGDSVTLHWCDDYVADESEGARQEFAARKTTVKAVNLKNGTIKLTWTAIAGAKQYKVLVATSKTGTYKLAGTVTGKTFTYKKGTVGKAAYFKVVGVNAEGTESAESKVVSKYRLPGQVGSLKVKSEKAKQVTLTWKKVTGAKKYFVYMSKNGKTGWKKIGTATTNKFTYKKGTSGKTLYFKVQAVTSTGKKGEFSAVKKCKVK